MSPSSSHCCSVVVAVVSLWCLRCHIVTVLSSPSWCHLHHHIVTVLSSPSWCHLRICHGFVVAVVVSPSCRSRFCRRRRGVAFVVTLSRFRHHRGVAFIVALSRCHHHGFVVAIVVLPSSSHCRGVIIAVASLQCLCCCIVAVSSSPS